MCAAVKINRLGKFDLNPRGNLWLKDENRFGHKLLSKMGWSQGKGLGKNEDGVAENLKVKMKSGNTGVGWSEKMPLAAENAEYDAVLANLNEKFNSSENKAKKEDVKSLELRSQQFKKRLHYGKFVRGKDVCRYSEKDMNSIFVVKKPKSEPTLARVKSAVTNIESSSTEDEALDTTSTFKSHLSMKDYFELKMKKKPDNTVSINNGTETGKTEETTEQEVSSKKKSKNKRLKLEPQTSDESSSEGNTLNINNGTETGKTEETTEQEVSSKKKSKNKRLKLEPQTTDESSSEGNPVNSTNGTETGKTEETTEQEVSSKKKSKSKRLKSEPKTSDETSCEGHTPDKIYGIENAEEISIEKDKTRIKIKTNKSREKSALKFDTVNLEDSSDEGRKLEHNFNSTETVIIEEPIVEIETCSRKRSKTTSTGRSKRLKLDLDLVEEYSSTNRCIEKESDDIIEISHCEIDLSKTGCNTIEDNKPHEVESTLSKKKKEKNSLKKAVKDDIIEISHCEIDLSETSCNTIEDKVSHEVESTVSKKKKEKNSVKKAVKDDIIEISHCEIDLSETGCNTIEDNKPHEVESTLSKKKKEKNSLRKADKRKRIKTEAVDISEESTSPEPSEVEVLGEFTQPEVQILSKKRKKLTAKKTKKPKPDVLAKLKTCLKGSWNYSLEKESRKVSFNENVCYRSINSDTEGDIKTEHPNECDVSEAAISLTANDSMDDSVAEDEDVKVITTSVAENGGESLLSTAKQNTDELCNTKPEADEMPNCMNLPKCNNSNYNSWLENQRLATKMKLYQNMIQKMKKHPVLKTSNILDLKGYGNWGF